MFNPKRSRRNASPEKQIQSGIEEWLSFQKELVAMPIDNTAKFDRASHSFIKKKSNRGALFYKGIPDILVWSKSHGLVGIEVKSLTGRQSPEQKEIQAKFTDLGAHYILVRSLDDVIKYFQNK